MRKLLAVLLLFCSAIVYGQVVPQGINYQAVALDQQGQPIPGVDIVGRPIDDAEIGVRISILEASPTGNVLYQEEHEVLTDQYGMFNLTIGQGLQVSADAFNTINWQGDKFLRVELSIENDGEFTLSAVQQLMSVPYAFLADRALNVDDADANPTNELQALSISNDTLYLSSGGFVVLPSDQINDADADPTNELQAISMSNDTLYLSSGGFVVLPPDQINDADADPTNEFQTITRNGSTINLSGNGGSVTVFDGDYTNLTNTPTIPSKTSDLVNDSGFLTSEVDGSTTNEIQTLSKSGSTISLSDNGGSVTVFDGDYNNLSNTPFIPTSTSDLTNDSGFLTLEVDGSTTNEIQTLSKSGSTISLSDNGGSVTVFDGDYNNLSNSPSIPTNTSDLTNDSGFLTSEVDGSTTNELQVLSISNDTIFLSDGGFIKLPASQGFDGDYNSLTNTPSIPTLTSDLTNDSGFLTSEVDGSTTNEIQTLSKSGSTISLSDNGGSVTVFDGDYNNLSNTPTIPTSTSDLINDSGFLTSELDSSTTNEIQTLVLSNDTLLLTKGGGEVYLSSNGNSTLSIQEKLDNGITPWQLLNDGVLKSSLYGKFYQGGIIIYLNDSTLSGMVITDFNVKSNVCPPSNYTGNATSEEIGDGLSNSAAISWSNATGACLSLVSNGYDDWFLPSIKELLCAPQNVPGWVGGEFWSSTVTTSGSFKLIQGNSVGQAGSNFCYPEVRAVRVFSNANTQSNLTFSLSVDDDLDSTNELQTLSISSDTVFLSNGGYVKLPASLGFDGDYYSLTNTPSIPTLTSDLTNDSGFLTSEVDGSTTNEIQTLSKSGSTISLSDNGGSITVFDGDYNNLSNTPTIPTSTSDLINDSGFLTSEVDSSTTNEIQSLSISNDTIFLSDGGGMVKIPSSSVSSGNQSYYFTQNPDVSDYGFGDMVFDTDHGGRLLMVVYGQNATESFFNSYPDCNVTSSSVTNKEYYVSFQVSDSIVVGTAARVCHNSGSTYPLRLYRHDTIVNYDISFHGLGTQIKGSTDSQTALLIPGFTYIASLDVFMHNSNLATSYRVSSVSNFTANSTYINNIAYFKNVLGSGYSVSNEFPTLSGAPLFYFSEPIKTWKVINIQ